ncbi:MAG: hypothetical protein BWX70_02335 [Verrucomicrobia bacterium ADurb.Bin070]|nr:MAG: hypothetical protein BWX70_02335 [Verrucomicrobia bacterium ADurb.Bin070]
MMANFSSSLASMILPLSPAVGAVPAASWVSPAGRLPPPFRRSSSNLICSRLFASSSVIVTFSSFSVSIEFLASASSAESSFFSALSLVTRVSSSSFSVVRAATFSFSPFSSTLAARPSVLSLLISSTEPVNCSRILVSSARVLLSEAC